MNPSFCPQWDEGLGRVSGKFRELDDKMRGYRPVPVPAM